MVLASEAYFDESGSHEGSPIICLAGYLLDSIRCSALDSQWRVVLEEYRLQYFRMSECAHRTGQFKGWADSECDVVARKMIALIKEYASIGIIVTMRERHFNLYKPTNWNPAIGPYSLCTYWCFAMARAWADKNNYQDHISYFFEAGHRHQTQTNFGIDMIRKGKLFGERTRYRSHAFVNKRDACALQAADLLAWEWYEECLSAGGIKKRGRRGSLKSLLEVMHIQSHFSKEAVRQFFHYGATGFREAPTEPGITLLSP